MLLIEVQGSPQQKNAAVDCGVVVLLIIKKYFEQKRIIREVAERELIDMRTDIVETLLNWSKDIPYYVDQLRKKRR